MPFIANYVKLEVTSARFTYFSVAFAIKKVVNYIFVLSTFWKIEVITFMKATLVINLKRFQKLGNLTSQINGENLNLWMTKVFILRFDYNRVQILLQKHTKNDSRSD